MTLKNLFIQIIIRFVFAALFISLAVNAVHTTGWGFMAVISVFFATSDIVKGTRMLQAYIDIKKSIDKK